MTTVEQNIAKITMLDKNFIGTVAFRSEEITLPDGSKIALGIDGGHWVLVYQHSAHANFKVFNYSQKENKILIDQKPGGAKDIAAFNKLVKYFLASANVEDLVTLIPPKG
ncbi:MAG: hypothetical protein ABH823_04485 [bacterium]